MSTFEHSEVGGRDPLDAEFRLRVGERPVGRLGRLLRRRPALGLAPVVAPVVVFVPLGYLAGPSVLGILTESALGHLDAVVSVALAVLGVFAGLALPVHLRAGGRLLAAATIEAGVTLGVVAFASLYLFMAWAMPSDLGPGLAAAVLAVCASASAAGYADLGDSEHHRAATLIADLDDGLPIIIGGLVLAAAGGAGPWRSVALNGLVVAVGVTIGLAGWVLVFRAHTAADRDVFLAGSILLLGGSAAYLALSPLLAGLSAGLFWRLAPGGADRLIRDALHRIQHPLVVLLLVVAGASIRAEAAAIWLFAPFLVFRLAGKFTGAWFAARATSGLRSSHLGAHLIAPGVYGIAFALYFRQMTGSTMGGAVLSAVTLGSLASEVLAFVAGPTREHG